MILYSILFAALIYAPPSSILYLAAFSLTLPSTSSHIMHSAIPCTTIIMTCVGGHTIAIFLNFSLLLLARTGLASDQGHQPRSNFYKTDKANRNKTQSSKLHTQQAEMPLIVQSPRIHPQPIDMIPVAPIMETLITASNLQPCFFMFNSENN